MKANEFVQLKLDEAAGDELLEQALSNFRLSVHAWSDDAYHRPRTVAAVSSQRIWRLAAGWALSCALAIGVAVGGVQEHRHRQELARIAAVQQADRQRLAAEQLREQQVREEDELLAKVDNDVSQTVPSAMEPLAGLTADEDSQ
jgi:uncharacterized protein HemX